MPRALLYDLKGAFGSLRQTNALYELENQNPAASSLWTSAAAPIIHTAAPIPPSDYQRSLDAGVEPPPLTTQTVRYWSDYARVYWHPRSLVQVREHEVDAGMRPFEKWEVGGELFEGLDREVDLLDRDLRPWVEECDQLQGIQVVCGADDAWGGFAGRYVERVRDEFGKKSVWVFGCEDESSVPRVCISGF